MPYHQNTFSERKLSNTTMVSTSLNGPNNKQNISNKNYDKSSNITKKEWVYMNKNSKDFTNANNMNNDYYKLEKIYQDKINELDISEREYRTIKDSYYKKLNNLEKTKKEFEILKEKNANLKKMILNMMKIKNITKVK